MRTRSATSNSERKQYLNANVIGVDCSRDRLPSLAANLQTALEDNCSFNPTEGGRPTARSIATSRDPRARRLSKLT